MKKFICLSLATVLLLASAVAQEGTGRRRGGGGGGSGSGTGSGSGSGSGGGSNNGGGSHTNNPGRGSDPDRRSGGGSSNGGGIVISSGGSSSSGSSSGSGGGGRTIIIDGRDTAGRGRGADVSSPRSDRSSSSHYGTVSNSTSRSNPINVGSMPNIGPGGSLSRRVNVSENIRVNNYRNDPRPYGTIYGGYRVGYYHYDRRWVDDRWCFSHYVFDPYYNSACVVSPWYWYASLPPYINSSNIVVVSSFPTAWVGSTYYWASRPSSYQYDSYDRYDYRRDRDLDYALDDLVAAFEQRDSDAVDRLAPRRGRVNIYMDSRYNYSLESADFYNMYKDSVDSTRTRRYEILSIRWNGRNAARVRARHIYEDPWGRESSVVHTYYLEKDRRDYVIREFGTSNF